MLETQLTPEQQEDFNRIIRKINSQSLGDTFDFLIERREEKLIEQSKKRRKLGSKLRIQFFEASH